LTHSNAGLGTPGIAFIRASKRLEIVCRGAAGTLIRHDFEGDLLTVVELAQTCALYGADVDEDVVSAIIRLDEPIPFLGVEPFYSSVLHGMSFRDW
jgi:hypothetical protein